MEKLLIHFDEPGYKSEISTLENLGSQFENIIDEFNAVGIGSLQPDAEECLLLFTDPEKLMFNKLMAGKPNKLDGLTVNKEKLFDLIDKPDGYFPFIEKIKKFNTALGQLGQSNFTKVYKYKTVKEILGFFDFSDLDAIALKPETFGMVKQLFEVYAETEKSKERLLAATEFCQFLNKSELFKKMGILNKHELTRFINFLEFTGNKDEPVKFNIGSIKNADTYYA